MGEDLELKKANEKIVTRWMKSQDYTSVLEIENNKKYPWLLEDFELALKNSKSKMVCKVLEIDKQIIGFFVMKLDKKFIQLVNFIVHPSFRLKGHGHKMMEEIKFRLKDSRKIIIAHVLSEDLDMQLFLQKMGFKAVETIPATAENEECYEMKFESS